MLTALDAVATPSTTSSISCVTADVGVTATRIRAGYVPVSGGITSLRTSATAEDTARSNRRALLPTGPTPTAPAIRPIEAARLREALGIEDPLRIADTRRFTEAAPTADAARVSNAPLLCVVIEAEVAEPAERLVANATPLAAEGDEAPRRLAATERATAAVAPAIAISVASFALSELRLAADVVELVSDRAEDLWIAALIEAAATRVAAELLDRAAIDAVEPSSTLPREASLLPRVVVAAWSVDSRTPVVAFEADPKELAARALFALFWRVADAVDAPARVAAATEALAAAALEPATSKRSADLTAVFVAIPTDVVASVRSSTDEDDSLAAPIEAAILIA